MVNDSLKALKFSRFNLRLDKLNFIFLLKIINMVKLNTDILQIPKSPDGTFSSELLKLVFYVLTLAVYILCLVFYEVGIKNYNSNPDVSSYIFEPWFVYFMVTLSLVGYAIVIYNLKTINIGFIITSSVLLVSLVFTIVRTYYTLKPYVKDYTSIQIWSFNVFLNTVMLMLYVVQNAENFILCLICLIPLFTISILYSRIGGIIAKQ
jgi:hypothetical protein